MKLNPPRPEPLAEHSSFLTPEQRPSNEPTPPLLSNQGDSVAKNEQGRII